MDGSFGDSAAARVRGFASEAIRLIRSADRRRLILMVGVPGLVLAAIAADLLAAGRRVSKQMTRGWQWKEAAA